MLWRPLRGEQRTPDNANTPEKRRFWEWSVTCVFGCVAFSGAFLAPRLTLLRKRLRQPPLQVDPKRADFRQKFCLNPKYHTSRTNKPDKPINLRKGRTWAIAVRRGSYESLFLLNSGRFSLEKIGKIRFLKFGPRKTV